MDNITIFSNKLIKNKDNYLELLLSALLEYYCINESNDPNNYKLVNKYIKELGIVRNDYSENQFSHIRQLYLSILKSVSNKKSQKLLTNKKEIKSYYYNNFIQLENIGSGGFGTVYKIYNKFDKNNYAIKKIPLFESFDKLYQEIDILSKLNHPNIVRYYNAWIEQDPFIDNSELEYENIPEDIPTIFIQMELCKNNLKEWLKHNEPTINIFKQILYGIQYIHLKNIVHGDIKLTNIFIDNNKNIKIGDFGLSKNITTIHTINSSSGTELYKSNDKIYSKKSDIYSLGILLFELFYPFNTEMERIKTIINLKKHIFPKNLKYKKIIKKMINNNPSDRPTVESIIKCL
jgi:serine/threonine protein kinase